MSFGPPAMGYDRAITIFSPEGKLYQVEYAFEAVRQGWTTLGIRTESCSAIVAEKRLLTPLMDIDGIDKIFVVDGHVGMSFAGFGFDGRVLIDYARLAAVRHRLLYGEPIDVEYLTKMVSDIKQAYTQHGGVRPFGVALIVAGVDDRGPRLFLTEPSGQYFSYYAVGIGRGGQTVNDYLAKHYKKDLGVEETLILGLKALSQVAEEKLKPEYVEIGYADAETGAFKRLTREEIADLLSKMEKQGGEE